MLKDITLTATPDPIAAAIAQSNGQRGKPRRLAEGVWQWGHWSPELDTNELDRADYDYCYGVCDDYTQLLELPVPQTVLVDPEDDADRWNTRVQAARMIHGPDPVTVFVVEIRRDTQPKEGGWRWHKWGTYIGKHEPQHEYLYDEEGIDRVFTFSVKRHRK